MSWIKRPPVRAVAALVIGLAVVAPVTAQAQTRPSIP